MVDVLGKKLAALQLVEMPDLKRIWQQHFDDDPIRFQRDYMIRRIAYQMQVKEYEGLPKTIRNKLKRLADEGQETIQERFSLAPGTRLMREYKGERMYVDVLEEGGFEFRGQRYKSLTAIATELMGCRTSGPKFFGLLRETNG